MTADGHKIGPNSIVNCPVNSLLTGQLAGLYSVENRSRKMFIGGGGLRYKLGGCKVFSRCWEGSPSPSFTAYEHGVCTSKPFFKLMPAPPPE